MLASEVKRKNMFSLQSRRSVMNDGDNWSQCGIRSSLWATDSFLFIFFPFFFNSQVMGLHCAQEVKREGDNWQPRSKMD